LLEPGQVVKTNAELLARFSPTDAQQDYGLDAVYAHRRDLVFHGKGITGPPLMALAIG
jgi:hypothetical protein